MPKSIRRLAGLVSLVVFAGVAAPARAIDEAPRQVLLQPRFVEVSLGLQESLGVLDLDTNFNNGSDKSFSRTREFVGIGIDMPVIDLGGPLVVIGADGRLFFDSTLVNFSFDWHPTNGKDVRVKVSNNVEVTPFVAVDFPLDSLLGDLAQRATARVLAGASIADYKNILTIDETGGGGNVEKFSESAVRVVTTIGGEIVLGGLFSNEVADVSAKLGGKLMFSDIPVLRETSFIGNSYRSRTREEGRVELMIIITPHLFKPTEE